MIRKAVYPIKQIGARMKITTISFRRYVSGQNSRPVEKDDSELGKQEISGDINPSFLDRPFYGKTQFRRAIEETFDSSAFTDAILNAIDDYEASPDKFTDKEYDPERRLKRRLHNLLWGYSELTTLFNNSLYPHLSPIHRIDQETNVIQHFLTYSFTNDFGVSRIRKAKCGHRIVAFKISRDGDWKWRTSLKVSMS